MPHPEQFLHSAMAAATGLTVWPLSAPEGLAPPYLVYRRVSTERERTTRGVAGGPLGTFEVEVYSDGYLPAKDISESVRLAVDTFKGNAGGVTIERVTLIDERDGEAVYFDGRDKPTYSVLQVFQIRWIEQHPIRSE